VTVEDEAFVVHLTGGFRVRVPFTAYERLRHATPTQRASFQINAHGSGIHWPDLDEDLSVAGLVRDFGIEHSCR
jgi:hypothetical protein